MLTHTHACACSAHALGAHTHVDIFYGDRRRRVGPESTHSTSSHSGAEHSIRVGMLRFFFFIANGSFSECHAMVGGAGSQSVVRRVNSFENNCVRNVRACVR